MDNFLCFEIPVNTGLAKDNDEIKAIIKNEIECNQLKLVPLFRQIIDRGDLRITIFDGSLQVTGIVITGDFGFAKANSTRIFIQTAKI